MKAKKEIIKKIEGTNHTLNKIKEGMDRMTAQEIQSASKMHQHLFGIKGSLGVSVSPKNQAFISEIENAVNEIMVQCQMHDILHQRIEHLMQIHEQLIAEISKHNSTWKYTRVLPDILKLNIWQTTDVQKLWVINIKLIIDSWLLVNTSCRRLEKMLAACAGNELCAPVLRQVMHHSAVKSSPLYDELFMSSYWQLLDMQFTHLSHQLHKETITICREERLSTLKALKKVYTMQAERDILIKLLHENGLLSEEEMISDTNGSDNFPELF